MALSRYGENQPHLRLASRFRVHADLPVSAQRDREQAEVYRERIIGLEMTAKEIAGVIAGN
ncbi:MAG: hypothetical protein WBJ62_03900 [Coriobacteriia bacterium]